jgi:hypothetical protein
MEAGLRLALTYLLHGVRVETRFRKKTDPRAGLTEQKRRYLSDLPTDPFTTNRAKQLAEDYDVTKRNVQRWLKNWQEAGLLMKLKRGTWAKLSPDLEGTPGTRSVISVINDIPALAGGEWVFRGGPGLARPQVAILSCERGQVREHLSREIIAYRALATSFWPTMRSSLAILSCFSFRSSSPPKALLPFSFSFFFQFERVTGWMS